MSNRIGQRLAAASGIFYVALAVVGNDVLGGGGQPPGLGDSRAKHAAYLATQGTPTFRDWASIYVEGLGLLALVVFVCTLWAVLRRAEGEWGPFAGIAVGAGLVSAAIKLGSIPPALATFYRVHDGFSPQLSTLMLDANEMAFVLTWGIDAVFLGAVAAVALRSEALPRWLAVAAAVLSPALLVGTAFPDSFGFLPFALTLLWFVATSIALVRRAGRPAESPALAPALA